jgi:hypothetical protein
MSTTTFNDILIWFGMSVCAISFTISIPMAIKYWKTVSPGTAVCFAMIVCAIAAVVSIPLVFDEWRATMLGAVIACVISILLAIKHWRLLLLDLFLLKCSVDRFVKRVRRIKPLLVKNGNLLYDSLAIPIKAEDCPYMGYITLDTAHLFNHRFVWEQHPIKLSMAMAGRGLLLETDDGVGYYTNVEADMLPSTPYVIPDDF